MTQVYDAGLGDVIEIPGHWPVRVTVTGWANAETPSSCIWSEMTGSLCRVTWTASGARGTTTLSDATLITMVAEAPAAARSASSTRPTSKRRAPRCSTP